MINWNTLSIGRKILVSFSVILGLFVIAGSIMMSSLIQINQSAKELHRKQIPLLSLANQIESEWQQSIFHLRSYALHKNDEYYFNGILHLGKVTKLVDSLKLLTNNENLLLTDIETQLTLFREKALMGRDATKSIHLNYLKLDSASHRLQDYSKQYLSQQYSKLKADLDKKEEDIIIKRRVDKINLMTEIVSLSEKIKTTIGEVNYLHNPALLNDLEKTFPIINRNINIIRPVTTKQYDLDALDAIETLAKKCQQSVNALNKSWANNSYYTDHQISEAGILLIRELRHNIENKAKETALFYQKQTFRAQFSWWIWLSIIILSIIFLSLFVSKSFSKPIIELTKISSLQAKGYFPEIDTNGRGDEIGFLLTTMKSGQEHTQKLVKNIQEMAAYIDILINQLHQKSIDLSQSSNNQADSTSSIASSINEMSKLSKNNRQNISNALAENTKTSELIMSHLEQTGQTILFLEKLIEKSNIINELSMQSYIVAINASVEAAKSGHDSRGFSVIAKSMRELAEKIRLNADEISSLVNKGRLTSKQTIENMDQIKFWIDQNKTIMQTISDSFYIQDNETARINETIQQLNHQTKKSLVYAEGITNDANQLGKHSLKLHSLLEFYKLEETFFDTKEIAESVFISNIDHLEDNISIIRRNENIFTENILVENCI